MGVVALQLFCRKPIYLIDTIDTRDIKKYWSFFYFDQSIDFELALKTVAIN